MKKIISVEEFIKNTTKNNQIIVVAGGYFGDEAKGKVVADLSQSEEIAAITRVNAGQNAGHTVFYNNEKIVLHLIPSGISTKKPTFIGSNCVGDLDFFYNVEIQRLKDKNIPYNNLFIGNINLVTPWHIIVDLLKKNNSSTGKGISQISQDIAGKNAPKLEDLINKDKTNFQKSFEFWKDKINYEEEEKLMEEKKLPQYLIDFIETPDKEKVDYTFNYLENIALNIDFPKIVNEREEITKLLNENKKIVVEGPQSFFLSIMEQTYFRSATSTPTDTSGTFASMRVSPKYNAKTLNIIKATASRVGAGGSPAGLVHQNWFHENNITEVEARQLGIDFNLAYKQFIQQIKEDKMNSLYLSKEQKPLAYNGKQLTVEEALALSGCVEWNEYGSTTKKLRVLGFIDLLHLKHLVKYQTSQVIISCVDRLDGLEKIPLINSYTYEGKKEFSNGSWYYPGKNITINDELPRENVLQYCKPHYKLLDGWDNSQKISEDKTLSVNLNNFIEYIEETTKCKIMGIGVSPETTIYFEKQTENNLKN